VQDIARVIQIDPPTDPDTYTHRSGRTGRAGRKGVSALLVAPAGLRRASALLQRARVQFRIEPIPTAAAIREAQDTRWLAELMQGDQREVSERVKKQVERIVEAGLSERALAQLIISVRRATGEPREVTPILPEAQKMPKTRAGRGNERERFEPGAADSGGRFERRPSRFEPRERFDIREPARESAPPLGRRPSERPVDASRAGDAQWVPFRVTWGEAHGADARRLVAMLCRRGGIRGSDIGAIRVSRTSSTVEVAAAVARGFEAAAREPDPRDPRVEISPLSGPPPRAPYGAPTSREPRVAGPPPGLRADVSPSRHRSPPRPSGPGPREIKPYASNLALAARPKDTPAAAPRPIRDEPPKRAPRRIVVNAPPPRRPKRK